MTNAEQVTAIIRKANAVIISCRTPAQLRVANTFAHRALGEIGQLSTDKAFLEYHFKFTRLIAAKSAQLKLRNTVRF